MNKWVEFDDNHISGKCKMNTDFSKLHSKHGLAQVSALAKDTRILYGGTQLVLCKETTRKIPITSVRMNQKTEYAYKKGMISDDSKQIIDQLYDMRNNVHILKAVKTNYAPKKHEAKDAYSLMIQVVSELKSFYNNNS